MSTTENNPSAGGQQNAQTGNQDQSGQTGSSRSGLNPDGTRNDTTGADLGENKPAESGTSENVKLREDERDMDINAGLRSGEKHDRTATGVVQGEPGEENKETDPNKEDGTL